MSALASLVRAYERMGNNAAPFGYSTEKIGFLISLNADGSVAGKPIDLREGDGKKKTSKPMLVPQPTKRTSGVAPNFLWDKTSYVLGVTAGEGKRTAEEHAAFVARHRHALQGADDEGLHALLRFLENWRLENFVLPDWPEEMKDQNVVFSLDSDRLKNIRIHDRPAARALWARLGSEGEKSEAICLITGEHGPIARLHPAIKGVWGTQSSGASIVSFNLDAFTSYGHEQGDNAPVSEAAAFAYTTALNRFLEKGSAHRVQIGDASTVFWAVASDCEAAALAEEVFGGFIDAHEMARDDERVGFKKVGAILKRFGGASRSRSLAPIFQWTCAFACWVCRQMPRGFRCVSMSRMILARSRRIWRGTCNVCVSSHRPRNRRFRFGACLSKRRRSTNRRTFHRNSRATGCGRFHRRSQSAHASLDRSYASASRSRRKRATRRDAEIRNHS